jgi:aspartate kinase
MERMLISGVALDKSADRISVLGLRDEPGIAFRLFDTIAKANVNVDVIVQATGRDGTKDISFTCPDESVQDALDALKRDEARLGYRRVDVKTDIAKLSIVGSGMMSNPGVAARMFEALYNEDINIDMISTSEIRITVLVDESDGERAVNAVHDAFGLAE